MENKRGRKKIKDGIRRLFYIEKLNIKKLNILADNNNMSVSSYLDFLIERTYNNITSAGKIKNISKDIETIKNKKVDLEKQEIELNQELVEQSQLAEGFEESKKQFNQGLEKKREKFVEILVRNAISGADIFRLKEIATNHSMLLDNKWSTDELLAMAMLKYKELQSIK